MQDLHYKHGNALPHPLLDLVLDLVLVVYLKVMNCSFLEDLVAIQVSCLIASSFFVITLIAYIYLLVISIWFFSPNTGSHH